jgi:amino acid transporter
MTNFDMALKIIENSKGITETQLTANKAAYIANHIALNRMWLIISVAAVATLIVLCILSAKSTGKFNGASDALSIITMVVGAICVFVIPVTAMALYGWVSDPAKCYADYILRMAVACLGVY